RKRGPRPKIATVERREASVLRHWTQGASQAPGPPRHVRAPTDAAASVCLSALRPPLGGGCRFQDPGAMRRGKDLCCAHGLFDIVRMEGTATAQWRRAPCCRGKCPLPLRERAQWCCQENDWVRGSFLRGGPLTHHDSCQHRAALSRKGRGRIR